MEIIHNTVAMVLAAGMGSRLAELTQDKPKALADVAGKPMLQHVLEKLRSSGIQKCVINLHHYPEQIRDFCSRNKNFGLQISTSDESEKLLDTGGALKYAEVHFEGYEKILVWNTDILSNLSIGKLIQTHIIEQNEITLAMRNRNSSRKLLFDHRGQLCGWRHKAEKHEILIQNPPPSPYKELAYSGIHIINSSILRDFPPSGTAYPLVPVWLDLAAEWKIGAYIHDDDHWFDCGKPETLAAAEEHYKKQELK